MRGWDHTRRWPWAEPGTTLTAAGCGGPTGARMPWPWERRRTPRSGALRTEPLGLSLRPAPQPSTPGRALGEGTEGIHGSWRRPAGQSSGEEHLASQKSVGKLLPQLQGPGGGRGFPAIQVTFGSLGCPLPALTCSPSFWGPKPAPSVVGTQDSGCLNWWVCLGPTDGGMGCTAPHTLPGPLPCFPG